MSDGSDMSEIANDSFVLDVVKKLEEADLILIDGGPRNLVMNLVALRAKPSAIVVVDNSDLKQFRFGVDALIAKGFVEIPLWGLGPLNPYPWVTSMMVRELNALSKDTATREGETLPSPRS